jgi:thiol-disulfide isomerase/thioredoxin
MVRQSLIVNRQWKKKIRSTIHDSRLTIDEMMLMKRLFPFLLFVVMWSCGSLSAPASAQALEQDDEINIKLKGTDGKTHDLAQLRGNVVVVSFGATWCQPCAEELRVLEQLHKEYEDKPVKFFWVSLEKEDEVSDGDLRSYAKRLKLSFPVLRDPTKFTFAQFTDRVRIPLVTIFNKEGKLVVKQTGMSTPEEYKTTIRSRLDKFLAPSTTASSTEMK